MTKISERLDPYLGILYEETNGDFLEQKFLNLLDTIPSLTLKDELSLTLFHHLCILFDRMKDVSQFIRIFMAFLNKDVNYTSS